MEPEKDNCCPYTAVYGNKYDSLYGDDYGVDVGMSRAFGPHDNCGENKYRQIQVLEILNDKVCNKLIAPYIGRWKEVEGIGENAKMDAGFLG